MLDDIASLTLQTAVTGLGVRQRVIANNIANLETPGFRAANVNFESSLADAVANGDPSGTTITTAVDPELPGLTQNGNTVSLDDQMVTATKTQLQQELVYGGLTSKYGLISTVLKG